MNNQKLLYVPSHFFSNHHVSTLQLIVLYKYTYICYVAYNVSMNVNNKCYAALLQEFFTGQFCSVSGFTRSVVTQAADTVNITDYFDSGRIPTSHNALQLETQATNAYFAPRYTNACSLSLFMTQQRPISFSRYQAIVHFPISSKLAWGQHCNVWISCQYSF